MQKGSQKLTERCNDYSVMCRQLEEVDKALEVHRETERVLHEKVTSANSSFSRYTVNCDVPVTRNCKAPITNTICGSL